MPVRRNPTARQERLGTELRKLREAAGMTAREAAGLLGTDPMQISHLEAGRVGVSEERLRRLAAHYACLDNALVDALVTMATERVRGWWEEYRKVLPDAFLDLAELEHHATSMRILQVVNIPGILQTADHVRALFAYRIPALSRDDLEAWVSHRVRRRRVLESPVECEAVVHEAALRMRIGGRKVARKQLAFILEQSERVAVRVIPFVADEFAGSAYSMLHVGGPVSRLDTVQLDALHGVALMDAESQVTRYRALYDKAKESALDPGDSRRLIRRIAQEI